MARARHPARAEDARVQIFTQSMCESFLEALYALYEGFREQKEHALCVFAFIAEVYTIIEEYVQPAIFSKFTVLITRLIGEVSRPSFFTDEVSNEYFNLLSSLVQRSPKLFASDAGTEYLAVFACSSAVILGGATAGKQFFEKQVKRTLLSFKQRDMIDRYKRSVFYCLMLKTILSLTKLDEQKAYRLLSTTSLDVGKLEEVKDLASTSVEPKQLA